MEPEDEYRIDEPLTDDFDMINQHLLEEDIGGEGREICFVGSSISRILIFSISGVQKLKTASTIGKFVKNFFAKPQKPHK